MFLFTNTCADVFEIMNYMCVFMWCVLSYEEVNSENEAGSEEDSDEVCNLLRLVRVIVIYRH